MPVLLAIALLFLAPLVMLLLRLARPGFAYQWLVATGATLVAWLLVLFSHPSLPQTIQLATWGEESLFAAWPVLLLDEVSWTFALALATLALALMLTAVVRLTGVGWRFWAASLTLVSLGLVAVLAGNPVTLLMAWTAIDLVEVLVLLIQEGRSAVRERVVIAFSARLAGSGMLLWAEMAARSSGDALSLAAIPGSASIFVLLAAGLRLGVLPLQSPFLSEVPMRRGLGTVLRLVPAAAGLALLARAASGGVPTPWSPYIYALAAIAALYGAVSWAIASDELNGRPSWLLGMASLALVAAARGQAEACIAWGAACLYSGSLMFLTSARHRNLLPLHLLGLLGFSTLPLTPNWVGASLFLPPAVAPLDLLLFPLVLIAHVFLLFGYARHALRFVEVLAGPERWVWVIYPAGLAILPLVSFLTIWLQKAPVAVPRAAYSSTWWVGLVAIGLVTLLWEWRRRNPGLSQSEAKLPGLYRLGMELLREIFSLRWLYRMVWLIYRATGRLVSLLSLVLEGEGGVLWTILLLVLMFAILVYTGPGG